MGAVERCTPPDDFRRGTAHRVLARLFAVTDAPTAVSLALAMTKQRRGAALRRDVRLFEQASEPAQI